MPRKEVSRERFSVNWGSNWCSPISHDHTYTDKQQCFSTSGDKHSFSTYCNRRPTPSVILMSFSRDKIFEHGFWHFNAVTGFWWSISNRWIRYSRNNFFHSSSKSASRLILSSWKYFWRNVSDTFPQWRRERGSALSKFWKFSFNFFSLYLCHLWIF